MSFTSHLRDLQLQAGYTLSRAVDPSSNIGGDGNDLNSVTNPYVGWKYDVGPSVIDRTHVAYVNFIYGLPIFRNSSSRFAKDVLGGWNLSGIVNMMSGLPVNLGISAPNSVCAAVPNCSLRPNSSGSVHYPRSPATFAGGSKNQTVLWFDPSSFSINSLGANGVATWGNFGYDGVRGRVATIGT